MQDIRELLTEIERHLGQGPVVIEIEKLSGVLYAIEALVKVVLAESMYQRAVDLANTHVPHTDEWVAALVDVKAAEDRREAALREFQAGEFAGLLEEK